MKEIMFTLRYFRSVAIFIILVLPFALPFVALGFIWGAIQEGFCIGKSLFALFSNEHDEIRRRIDG